MDVSRVPEDLRDRLGPEATVGLVGMFNEAEAEWRGGVTEHLVARFERRLVEETSALRIRMVEGFAALRQDIGSVRDELREEIAASRRETGSVRDELREQIAASRQETGRVRDELRQEMAASRQETAGLRLEVRQESGSLRQEIGGLRAEIATDRFELLKWTFIFWVGQVFAIGSLVALLLRFVRPVA